MIFILGMPRSGTTWLAKIFDSHPDTLYRHEPDSALPTQEFPFYVPPGEVARYIPVARKYIESLICVRRIKSSGSLPQFPKSYYSFTQRWFRECLIFWIKAAERGGPAGRMLAPENVPDLIDLATFEKNKIVIKSVVALGRAHLFCDAAPQSKFIFILRHPCAYVASIRRGRSQGKLGGEPVFINVLAKSDEAQRFGVTLEQMEKMSFTEQLAWNWTIFNEKALHEVAERKNVMVVRHEDLCLSPLEVVAQLFDFAGLEWNSQTDAFVNSSSNQDGHAGYFDLNRKSELEVEKWKRELSDSDANNVLSIVRGSAGGGYYC